MCMCIIGDGVWCMVYGGMVYRGMVYGVNCKFVMV